MDGSGAEKYAEVILKSGVNLAEGQSLLLRADPANRWFAEVIARKAYELGSPYVHVVYGDTRLEIARVAAAREDTLSYVPSFTDLLYRTYIDENWASVALTGPENPDAYEGVDSKRLGAVRKANSRAARGWMEAISSNRIRWNVCLWPTPGWASKVLGTDSGWEKAIWEVLTPILRLDRDDPAAAWLEHDAELKRRAAFLNEARFDRFHLTGPGTDLIVGMAPDRVFAGGRCTAEDGRMFFPNIPTEEVFSTPDFRRTEGRVRCTRPVQVNGTNVEGAWFEFEAGRVKSFGADRNEGALGEFLSTDEHAGFLGEIALVGTDSPIYRSGRIFHSILFDENAAIHIALGNGYTECVEGMKSADNERLLANGCNVSLVHTDFMVGSDEVGVDGLDKAGNATRIISAGRFVI